MRVAVSRFTMIVLAVCLLTLLTIASWGTAEGREVDGLIRFERFDNQSGGKASCSGRSYALGVMQNDGTLLVGCIVR